MTTEIAGFSGKYNFLSNFYPVEIEYQGLTFASVEQAYQWAKLATAPKGKVRFRLVLAKIHVDTNPAHAKRLARDVWEQQFTSDEKLIWIRTLREPTMLALVRDKFNPDFNPILARLLEETGDLLVTETNYWHDNTWGECTCLNCRNRNLASGGAQNKLGKIIMQVRAENRAKRHAK